MDGYGFWFTRLERKIIVKPMQKQNVLEGWFGSCVFFVIGIHDETLQTKHVGYALEVPSDPQVVATCWYDLLA